VADSLRDWPIAGVRLVEPAPLTRRQLVAVHDPAYVDAVAVGRPRWLAESNGLPWDEGIWDAACASSGGAVAGAVDALTSRQHAGSLSSGLHHASAGSGRGFCTFNGLALAARAVLDRGASHVLILDLDAHCGRGTWSIVRSWHGVVHTDISVSSLDAYRPQPGRPSTLDIVRQADDYLPTLTVRLAALEGIAFDLVMYNAGMDPHQASALGGLRGITLQVLARRECLVFDWARSRGVPVAFVLAGGYSGAGLSSTDLAGLHRLTIAAAALGGSDEFGGVDRVIDAAYAEPHRGTEM
jgi:acetoin utilization deacetylase AcuC-like enzyme